MRSPAPTGGWKCGRRRYPQVPDHLLLGKGYYVSASDFQNQTTKFGTQADASNWGAAIAGDYHNGPLSVVMFFGIWGVIAVLWFWSASLRALYLNYRHGDPALHTYNTFFLVYFLTKILLFLIIFGSLYSDMFVFTGIIGMSISLNSGIRRLALTPVRVVDKHCSAAGKFRLAFPAFLSGLNFRGRHDWNVKPKLLIVELWGLGDLAIASPFLRTAAEKFDVTSCSPKPFARELQMRLWPDVHVETFVAPWTAFKHKYHVWRWPFWGMGRLRRRLAAVRFDCVPPAASGST